MAKNMQVGKRILVTVELAKRLKKLLLNCWFTTAAPLDDDYFTTPTKAKYEANV